MADSALSSRAATSQSKNQVSTSTKTDGSVRSKQKKASNAKTANRTKETDKSSAKPSKVKLRKDINAAEDAETDTAVQKPDSKAKSKPVNQSQSVSADIAGPKSVKDVKKDKRFANLTPEAKQAKRREERQKRQSLVSSANALATAATQPADPEGKALIEKDGQIQAFKSLVNEKPAVKAKREKEKLAKAKEWRVSQPIGGRFSTNNLIYSPDEKYIMLAQGPSLKIFSTKTSLLYRTLHHLRPPISNFPYTPDGNYSNVANYVLDPSNPNQLYTITFGGEILLWDWTEGTIEGYWKTDLNRGQYLAWCGLRVYPKDADSTTNTLWTYHEYSVYDFNRKAQREICAFNIPKIPSPDNTTLTHQAIFKTEDTRPRNLVILDANTFVMDSGEVFYIGNKQKAKQESESEWRMRRISASAKILTIDAIIRQTKKGTVQGDVAIGDNMGQIFIYHDILSPHGPTAAQNVVKSKLHWHRTGISSVKYSRDGTYLISGGRETVLVIWQLSTSFQQTLPHLGATIKNIFISPSGSEYCLILADNSCLTISTTELKPKAAIAGIQSRVFLREEYHKIYEKGGKVSRKLTRQAADLSLSWRIPCVKNPWDPMQILLAAPAAQKGENSYPYLQTFDLSQDRGIGKQAITRTFASTKNVNPENGRIKEPNVKLLSISGDGTWLASVDEWAAPARDFVDPGAPQPKLTATVAKEVILRFWRWNSDEGKRKWELVSMIENPHGVQPNGSAGQVADLTGSPKSNMFASVGGDGTIKIWGSRLRTRAGVKVEKDDMVVWNCRRNLELFKGSSDAIQDGRIAYSEDGSVVAVSYSDGEDGIITLIDPITGTVQQEISSLQTGTIFAITFVDKYLVIAGAQRVVTWNLITGQSQWGSELNALVSIKRHIRLDNDTFVPNIHLAANPSNNTFAIAVNYPLFNKAEKAKRKLEDLTKAGNTASMVSVFKVDGEEGAGIELLSRNKAVNGVLSLGATQTTAAGGIVGGSGYFWLDGAANVYFLSGGGIVGSAIDGVAGSGYLGDVDSVGGLANAFLEKAVIDEVNLKDELDEDEGDGKVVRSHNLARLFPAPAYASPAVGDVFGRFMEIVGEKALDMNTGDVISSGEQDLSRGALEMPMDTEELQDSDEDSEDGGVDISMADAAGADAFANLPNRKFDVIIDEVSA